MDHFRRRERRRLLEDLIDLQREEDIQRQCESIIYSLKGLERHRIDSDDDDDEYKTYQHRRKEYCLVTITYRNPNNRQGENVDEIMIIQNHRTVFKGCLHDGDQFTLKSQRDSKIKLKFYVNDLFEEQMIGCCEHELLNKKRRNHLFQIENIIGAKSCDNCESDDNNTSRTLNRISHSNSSRKVKISPSSSEQSEDQSYEQKPKEKKSTLSIPQTHNNKALSEGFSADITEFSDDHTELRNQSDEESTDVLPSIPQAPSKRTYGPPQLSMVSSINESFDTPSPNIRESTSEIIFNSSTNTQERRASHPIFNRTDSTLSIRTTDRLSRQTSTIEPNQNEQATTTSLTNSNNIAIANDATQLLLTRLGIIRQEQVERPEVSSSIPPREKGNVEYFVLIYLHESNPDESIIQHLRRLINFVKIFNDTDDCVAFINTISNEKILLILSNSFYNSIIPKIEELQQIYTIYVLSEDENRIDLSAKQFQIRGFYQNLNDIYNEISHDINKISRDLITYLNTSSNGISIEPLIEYSLLLGETILDRTERKDDIKELIILSRQEYEGNDAELKIIDEFENTYKKNQAIHWFSRQCFISKMLNKALRVPQPDILFRLRVFIQDLYQQIETESTPESITVYLGQTIQRNDLDDLQNNLLNNDLIIFPQFLFGSTDQSRAICIAQEIPLLNENMIPLLIRVEISEEMKWANLNSLDEDNNVLLNMNMMGRLIKIEKENINESHIATIHIRLIKANDQRNLQQILETKRAEVKSFSTFVTIIKLMIQMNQQTSAEQFVQAMFDDENLKTDASFQGSIAASCHILAQACRTRDDYKGALNLYLLSLNTFHRIVSPNAVELTSLLSNIGSMYFRLADYDKSLEYYQRALEIQIHSNTPELYSVSVFTNSIGTIYSKQGKYAEAVIFFERTVKILQQIPESHDTELATTYDDLGDAYLVQTKFDEALKNYLKGLEIQERLLPRNSQALGTTCHTIGNLYLKLGRSKEALVHLKRALEYLQENLPIIHPTFALLYNNIGLMYYREEQYDEALQSYSKTLEIAAIALPENHSLVGITLFNMALAYSSQEKLDEAIESIEKSTVQFLKTLPPDHPDVMENTKYLESIRQKKILKGIFEENTISF